MIEKRLREWNKILEDPLREQDLMSAFRYHKSKKTGRLPPNCDNPGYYLDFNVCQPDGLCKKIKNPTSYVRVKVKALEELKAEQEKERLKEERKKSREEAKIKKEEKARLKKSNPHISEKKPDEST